jgi:hypothetical protein
MADTKQDSAATPKDNGPPTARFKVRSSHSLDQNRGPLFSTVSEKRARAFIQNRFPRGEEAYLETPDGKFESFQQERTGPYGEDVEQWAAFDPKSWAPPAEQAPPGESAWSDVEG